MPGHQERAPRLEDERHGRHGELQQAVERGQLALDAATACRIDDREVPQIDHVACRDDVGTAEMHDAVAVRMCAGLSQHLHGIVIDVHRPVQCGVRFGRPHAHREGGLVGAHARQHLLVREHRRLFIVAEAIGVDGDAGRGQDLVTADVIGVGAGVDDETDRQAADRLHRGKHLLRRGRRAAIDQDDAVFADMRGDVATMLKMT